MYESKVVGTAWWSWQGAASQVSGRAWEHCSLVLLASKGLEIDSYPLDYRWLLSSYIFVRAYDSLGVVS